MLILLFDVSCTVHVVKIPPFAHPRFALIHGSGCHADVLFAVVTTFMPSFKTGGSVYLHDV